MPDIKFHPVTRARRDDFEALFSAHGVVRSCWCMWWRATGREFDRGAAANHEAITGIIDAVRVPGLLAYREEEPIGWVSVAPRTEFGRVARSRLLAPSDETPAWSVVCFFVPKTERGNGLADALLDAAVQYAHSRGAILVEGYPVTPTAKVADPGALFSGTESMFLRAGFERFAHRGGQRSIVRKYLASGR